MSRDHLRMDAVQMKQAAADLDVDAEHNPDVARRGAQADVRRQAAQQGTATARTPMPHMDRIQASFGDHDISGVQAHVDSGSTAQMGAEAYATGNHVVFGSQPDLHTAAHEAAHVVQQREGVHLKGGVGEKGDTHEQKADAVADRVVAGESAADLLGPAQNDKAPAEGQIQKKDKPEKPHDHKEDHEASNQESYEAARASLTLLATRLHAGAAALKSGLALDPGPAKEQFLGDINKHFDRMKGACESALTVFNYNLDQTRQGLLSIEVGQVVGAFEVWKKQMELADAAATAAGFTQGRYIHLAKAAVDGFAEKVGLKTSEVKVDRTAPAGDVDSATQTMLHEHMQAAMAAVTSTKSDSGTTDSIRARKHAQEILWIANTMPNALHKKDKQFIKMKQAIREMEVTHPGMKSDLEAILADLDRAAK